MNTEEKIAELRALWVRRKVDEFDMVLGNGDATYAESPIERLFVAACLADRWRLPCFTERIFGEDRLTEAGIDADADRWWKGGMLVSEWNNNIVMASQVPLVLGDRRVRLDFAVFVMTGAKLAIEFDGHDFHERTKEQAERDKSRDRLLTARGWAPVRFTGSEVWRDPAGIVNQVHTLIASAMRQP